MDDKSKLYPGWSEEVQDVMEDGVGMLAVPIRTANSLEEAGILTVYDLLLRSMDQLSEVANMGDKSFNAIKLALRQKGFRRLRGYRYDPAEPLHMMYEGCFPERDDPKDLAASTAVVDSNEVQLLTHKQALERVVIQLEDVQSHFGKKTKQFGMLKWIKYYAQTRLPEEEKE